MVEGEKNLIDKARKGNSEAFGALYDYYLPKIYRFVLFKVSHKQQAEDITQQTFMKAWEKMGTYKPQGYPFGSWLYQIARNSVIDHYRKNDFRVDIEEVAPEALGIDDSLVAKLEVKFDWEEVLQAIGGLSQVEQDVLLMRFVEDLPHEEVAQAVQKSESAVKVIQHRALKKLKGQLSRK